MDYNDFFKQATKFETTYPYQETLGSRPWPDFLEIPTGLGKTAAVVLAWLYKRTVLQDSNTPRRLVYCLPMRVLAEQTEANIRCWLDNLGGDTANIPIHLLMGGEQDLKSWTLHPEQNAILIGTQDMLLSRALMRGYGMSRYQWPVHFALLHNDALWVFDEVQLMGAGLGTSAQLEAFRRQFKTHGNTRTLWVSATLNRQWLNTVDFAEHLVNADTLQLAEQEKQLPAVQKRFQAIKRLQQGKAALNAESKKNVCKTYLAALVDQILETHQPESNTLVILNSVERAQGLMQLLQKQKTAIELLLVHARFRAAERRQLNFAIQNKPEGAGRIIVATQAVEAGVDISSRILFTELAPWASLVQRFGRCNRAGEYEQGADIFWLDIDDDKSALPYAYRDIEQSRDILRNLTNAAPSGLPPVESEQAISPILRRKDFLDLFNTDADLTGFDSDISLFIRDEGLPQLRVFWRDFQDSKPEQTQPGHTELCPVSISQIKAYLGKDKQKAYVWDGLSENWKAVNKDSVYPGMTLLLRCENGGYDATLGFIADSKTAVEPLLPVDDVADSYQGDADSRKTRPILLEEHLVHVAEVAQSLIQNLKLDSDENTAAIGTAAAWHDVGKSHPVFQETMIKNTGLDDKQLWAKSSSQGFHSRRYFRHELASMLAWLAQGEKLPSHDLIAYLIAAHHGKVRMSLRAMPDEPPAKQGRRFARGVHEGDCLPPLQVGSVVLPETALQLDVMELGESAMGASWTTRTQRLLVEHGPFLLSWYETLVRIADWRASDQEQK
ncbi:type I-G CRISPR-associated helicase/endonuclease Cas3g [Candidatus Methylobacter oryzae]|uniref:CRISPR-associated helicase Cas3 n=1 Tax=Candidatus Methylobacter oryzae TaxID=2497749 RepID=A0ABY3CDL4_9GAMM|nr:CRISPR-associated helicase Cas3' [Candidatus Methylobacter oryzae]TRX00747.1 CRISPR-associated helicase Cas3' [Candidatus Methylobacter oryzae]